MLQQLRPAIMSVVAITIITGFLFPAIITGIAQVAFAKQANGSLITEGGKVIGSELIAQGFAKPEYFHPRQSVAGNGYDPTSSGGTNLGPTSDKLINGIHKKTADGKDDPSNFDGIKDLAVAYRKENNLADNAPVPADAATRSCSGLDPHISPENAALQVARVAKARGVSEDTVNQLVAQKTEGRALGFIGEPVVNVLLLNLALDKTAPMKSTPVPAASPSPATTGTPAPVSSASSAPTSSPSPSPGV
jgi:K+-transporting ATPase ATPase C chain